MVEAHCYSILMLFYTSVFKICHIITFLYKTNNKTMQKKVSYDLDLNLLLAPKCRCLSVKLLRDNCFKSYLYNSCITLISQLHVENRLITNISAE